CLFLKFTSFFILVIMINLLVFYYHDRKLTMRYSILMLGTLPSLFILGLNNNLLESFTNGLQTFTLIDSNHNLGLLWQYTQQFIYLGIMVGLRTIIALPCFILWYKSKKNYLFALGFISGTLLPSVDLSYGASRFLQLSSIGYFWLIVLYVYGYLIEKKVSDKANIPLIICYLCLPYILALGSNNQIYIQILLFFITTMIIIINNLIQINHRLIKNIILLTILLFTSFQLIYEQLSIPYRTANKIHNLVKIKLATLGTIYLNKDLANYITNSLSLLKQCQFKTNDNIIALYDLPSLVYLAGANSYACPWYFNYNGAENMVNFCLNLYPSGLINKSFLILDNDVNLNKFNQILLNYGTSLKQYKYCGKVVAPSVMGMNLKNIKIYAPIVK
ncbi:MAG: hypothetical protein RLZZ293_84, partial [Pseudomonadota bacterium]